MAVKIEFSDLFKSMSGTISRKRLPDGRTKTIVVTKKGSMYETTYNPPKKLTQETIDRRAKFGCVAKATAIVCRELGDATSATRKQHWKNLSALYDRLKEHGKVLTPEKLAEMYAYFLM